MLSLQSNNDLMGTTCRFVALTLKKAAELKCQPFILLSFCM